MLLKFSRYLTITAITAVSCIVTNQAQAQEYDSNILAPTSLSIDVIRPGSPLSLPELMNQAYWENSGDFFEGATILGQLNFILGWRNFPEGSYAENNIARDSLLMTIIVNDYFKQLQQREPTIRTKDLPNPFNSSVNQNSCYLPDSQEPCNLP